MSVSNFKGAIAVAAAIATTMLTPARSEAALTLTSAGVADGFTLSTFAVINPGNTGCCSGPFGLAVTQSGTPTVLVSDAGNNTIYTFADTDGQTTASATHTSSGAFFVTGATAVGSTFWGSNTGIGFGGGSFVTYSANLATVATQTVTDGSGNALGTFRGMTTAPNGHVIATTNNGLIIEITPGVTVARVIVNSGNIDGVSVSPDGTKIVAAVDGGGPVRVYDFTTGALIATYSPSNLPDGTGVIAGGALAGDIVAAGNTGDLDLIDSAGNVTTIATGGQRLDYTAPDSNNGSLLIDSSDVIYRLACTGNACSIGSNGTPPPAPAPEPAALTLLTVGLAGLGFARRRVG